LVPILWREPCNFRGSRPPVAPRQNDADELPRPSPEDEYSFDLHFVLDLADRCNARGDAEGVKLCQQLIDSMLRSRSTAPTVAASKAAGGAG
jgi:hypothetical protein